MTKRVAVKKVRLRGQSPVVAEVTMSCGITTVTKSGKGSRPLDAICAAIREVAPHAAQLESHTAPRWGGRGLCVEVTYQHDGEPIVAQGVAPDAPTAAAIAIAGVVNQVRCHGIYPPH